MAPDSTRRGNMNYTEPFSGPFGLAANDTLTTGPLFFDPGQIDLMELGESSAVIYIVTAALRNFELNQSLRGALFGYSAHD